MTKGEPDRKSILFLLYAGHNVSKVGGTFTLQALFVEKNEVSLTF